ncbi:hypothetical protein B0T14DRAFT_233346 [Immersiella caudata]|uniref:Uncharacterized protein n=1 Tax=Immersiella caudata TaxID=314043 RepID=A0AA39WRZ8_9PEZI|nr:hypothetical protein B0T14DRAFT_233346 [Immersiella caudata]
MSLLHASLPRARVTALPLPIDRVLAFLGVIEKTVAPQHRPPPRDAAPTLVRGASLCRVHPWYWHRCGRLRPEVNLKRATLMREGWENWTFSCPPPPMPATRSVRSASPRRYIIFAGLHFDRTGLHEASRLTLLNSTFETPLLSFLSALDIPSTALPCSCTDAMAELRRRCRRRGPHCLSSSQFRPSLPSRVAPCFLAASPPAS